MFARIHEKMKALYGDTLCLRLLELIPAAVILASFVCHACLTYEEPREIWAGILIPVVFFGYLLLETVFSLDAVVRITALLLYCFHFPYRFMSQGNKHGPGDPLEWKLILYFIITIAGFTIITTREHTPLKVQIHTDRHGYVGTLDAPSAGFLIFFLFCFAVYLFC